MTDNLTMPTTRASQIYFDCNATTPALPQAAEAAMSAMRSFYGNPSSTHVSGLQAKHILELTRQKAARLIGAEPMRIVFTSGATEGIQIAVFSALQSAAEKVHAGQKIGSKLLYGATEHKAVPQALQHWTHVLGLNLQIMAIPVNAQGQLDLEFIKQHAADAVLICTMAVNNETGVISDLRAVEKALRQANPNALWLVDCVQALGKLPLQLREISIDYAPFSGHKLYAPKGIGFLYARDTAPLIPLIVGGGQERGLRSGTENLPGVAALGSVLDALLHPETGVFHNSATLHTFRDQIVSALRDAFPDVVFNTPFDVSVPTTVNFAIPDISSRELINVFDAAGVRMSAGSACSSGKAKRSYVLDAMNCPEWASAAAVRLSFGPATTEEEIARGCAAIRDAATALRASCHLINRSPFEAPEQLRDGVIQFISQDASNTWLISDKQTRECIIIDPTEEVAERLMHFVECQGAHVLAVLDTHSHADHESCRPMLQTVLRSHMPKPDAACDALGWPATKEQCVLANGEKADYLAIGKMIVARVATPGHTSDSQSFIMGHMDPATQTLARDQVRFVFGGDTVLIGGLGRTNFPSSDASAMYQSVRRLDAIVNGHSLVCPAHDYDNSFVTFWDTERHLSDLLAVALNPWSALAKDSFLAAKKERDLMLAEREQAFNGMVCGVVNPECETQAHCSLSPGLLGEFAERCQSHGDDILLIDVREPSEFAMLKDWQAHGLPIAPKNVPLSRLANFLSEISPQQKSNTALVFICQSGTRSVQAARSLRRLGFVKAWSVEGGMAYGCNSEWTQE